MEVQKGGDICIPMADSCWGLTENNKNFFKKECILVSSNEVDEPRAYYTGWSKSER